MKNAAASGSPLVSVIIPCYNHGAYLAEAIDSVRAQTWAPVEIIVVDDGSSDNTRAVAEQYPGVRYVYQTNQGLSAARNTGMTYSRGDYLVFLDADDWLYPDGIAYNVGQLEARPDAAFVSGAHDKVDSERRLLAEEVIPIENEHYLRLLEGNYIGMHATVLYRRTVFDQLLFDTTLRACEDYDLYLKIARRFPVLHHTHKIAAYRIHTTNMSGNVPMMLHTVFAVLARQPPLFTTEAEWLAYRRGQQIWSEYYSMAVYDRLRNRQYPASSPARAEALKLLRTYKPNLFFKYWITKLLPLSKRS